MTLIGGDELQQIARGELEAAYEQRLGYMRLQGLAIPGSGSDLVASGLYPFQPPLTETEQMFADYSKQSAFDAEAAENERFVFSVMLMYGILMPGIGELVAAAPELAEISSLSGSSKMLSGRQIYQNVGRPGADWTAKTVRSFSFTPYEGRLGAALGKLGVQRPYMDEVVITQRNWQTASTCDMPHEMSHVRFGRNYPQFAVLQNRTWLPGSGYSAWVDEALAYGPESGSRFAFYRALDSLSFAEKANILATSAGLVGAGSGIYLSWSNYLRK